MSKKRAKHESKSRVKLSMRKSNESNGKNTHWNLPALARLTQSNSLKTLILVRYHGERAKKQAEKLEYERRACAFGVRRPDTK